MGAQTLHEGATERLHQYWVHGEGAAKIRWGEPGDFDRCVRHLSKYIDNPQGYCNLAHHSALGFYPATHAKMEHGRSAVTHDPDGLDASWDGDLSDLPDLAGLDIADFDAAAMDLGMTVADSPETGRAAKLGSGSRFKALSAKLAAKGASNPDALAAYIGRKKYGARAFGKLARGARKAAGSKSRFEGRAESLATYTRNAPLQDIEVKTAARGKIVTAYMAVFNTPASIHDQDGEYDEELDPAVFNKAISDARPQGSRNAWRTGVFYNHGLTIMGTPSEMFSVPLGVPLDIRPDSGGVVTQTQYHRSEFADTIVEGLESGAIPGYSFSGRFIRSSPLIPRGGFRRDRYGNRPTVRRMESTLREYGPTPFPAYKEAAIVGMRAALLADMAADPDFAARMLRIFSSTPGGEPLLTGTSQDGMPPPESRLEHSARSVKEQIAANAARFRQLYGR